MSGRGGRLRVWLDERLGLSPWLAQLGRQRIPGGRRSAWYFLGGLALLLFCVQVATGLLLAFYYEPGDGAAASVARISETIPHGSWIRSLHAHGSDLMVGAVLVHMGSAFFLKAYRRPRELTWFSGIVLAGLVLSLGFTGSLLRVDETAFAAAGVSLGILERIPLLGPWLVDTLLGGATVGDATLRRFFVFHAMLLPLAAGLVVAFHLAQVHRHGIAARPAGSGGADIPLYPDFARREAVLWVAVVGALSAVATLAPAPVLPPADPLASPSAGLQPEWFAIAPYELLRAAGRVLPGAAGEVAVFAAGAAVLLFWVVVPWLDPSAERRARARSVTWFGALVVVGFAAVTAFGYLGAGPG